MEERNAVKQWLRASRCCLVGGRERSTHPFRHRRRVPDLPERADGQAHPTFGQEGRIDLTQGLGRSVDRNLYGVSSPPIISRDVVVMGSKVHDYPLGEPMPPGDVRGFNVRTGKQQWLFRAIPVAGEFGNET